MDSNDYSNSTRFDSVIYVKSPQIVDNTHGLIYVLHLTQYEEAQANNGLKASIFMHSFVIICTAAIIVLDMNLVDCNRRDKPQSINIKFALLSFSLKLGKQLQKFKYECILDTSSVEMKEYINTTCTISKECLKMNFAEYLDVDGYDLTCDDFSEFRIIGLLYSILLSLGSLFGFCSIIILLLLLYEIIKLEKCEIFINLSKFESIIYFFGFLIYYSYANIYLDMNSRFLKQDWFFIILFGISFSNFLVIRTSFYNKLKIKSRIL